MKRWTDKQGLIKSIKKMTSKATVDGSALQTRSTTVRWDRLTEYELYTVLALMGKLRDSSG